MGSLLLDLSIGTFNWFVLMFKKDRYQFIPKLLSKELYTFLQDYLATKRRAYGEMRKINYISKFDERFGTMGDHQVPGEKTFCLYGDSAFDLVADNLKSKFQKHVGQTLYTTYTYTRFYTTGDTLKKHIDRHSCEISGTINLGGDLWPIYMLSGKKKVKVDLKPGDGLIYRGLELPHWRDTFKGKECSQLFVHYSLKERDKWDHRRCLGVPLNVK